MWDQLTNECTCAANCLSLINEWSNGNKNHFPIYLILEPKIKPFIGLGEHSLTKLTSKI